MIKFESINQLRKWLDKNEVSLGLWGQSETKSIESLWREICAGESQIQDNPPLRNIKVVNIIIRRGDRVLIERKQQLVQNQVRYRGLPPAEKIRADESYIDAVIRGLNEELQIDPHDLKVLTSSVEPQISVHESQSYPGLATQYVVYEVEVEINNLPDQDFWTQETSINDPVVKHQWGWDYWK